MYAVNNIFIMYVEVEVINVLIFNILTDYNVVEPFFLSSYFYFY